MTTNRLPSPPTPSAALAQAALGRAAPALGRAARRPRPSGQPRPLGPAGGAPAGPAGRGPRRTARNDVDREDAFLLDLARQFAAAYLEIEAGRRGVRQLLAVGWARVPAQPVSPRAATAPGRVVSVAGTRTLPGRFDAVALVRRGHRFGALVIRLTRHTGTWIVDDARCPEDVADTGQLDRGLMAARPGLR